MTSQLLEAITPGISALCNSVVNVPGIMSTSGIQLINSVKNIVSDGMKQAAADAKLAAINEVKNIRNSAMGSLQTGGRVKPCGCSCTRTIRHKRKKLSSTFKKKYT